MNNTHKNEIYSCAMDRLGESVLSSGQAVERVLASVTSTSNVNVYYFREGTGMKVEVVKLWRQDCVANLSNFTP